MPVMAGKKAMTEASSSSIMSSTSLSDKCSFGRKAMIEGGGSGRRSSLNLQGGSFLKKGVHDSFVEREQLKVKKMVEQVSAAW